MCWKDKRDRKQGPLPASAAWSLITLYFSVSAAGRSNSSQVARLTYSLVLFLFRILSYLWVLAHALPAVPSAFTNPASFRKYQYVLQRLDNCGSSPKWSLLPKSTPGASSLYSQWLPEVGPLRALTTLDTVIACIFYGLPLWIWDPWNQESYLIYLCNLSNQDSYSHTKISNEHLLNEPQKGY